MVGCHLDYLNILFFISYAGKRLEESFGIMANYNYILDYIESNNKQYLRNGAITISNIDPVLVEEAKNSPNIKVIKIIQD